MSRVIDNCGRGMSDEDFSVHTRLPAGDEALLFGCPGVSGKVAPNQIVLLADRRLALSRITELRAPVAERSIWTLSRRRALWTSPAVATFC